MFPEGCCFRCSQQDARLLSHLEAIWGSVEGQDVGRVHSVLADGNEFL